MHSEESSLKSNIFANVQDPEVAAMFDLTNKKKKKKKIIKDTEKELEEDDYYDKPLEVNISYQSAKEILDYPTYSYVEDLLPRCYLNTPAVEDKKTVLYQPVITHKGRKTTFENYDKFIESFQKTNIDLRKAHTFKYLLIELCCKGQIANSKVVLLGKFKLERIINILRQYIVKHVQCDNCSNLNTTIQKCSITHHYCIQCDKCKCNPKYLEKF
jgi:translation initiation factor 2 beta subunit (eIF-2beta)/eIF-5